MLVAAVALSLVTGLSAGQKQKDKKSQTSKQEKIFIPKEIKAILAEGLAGQQGRQDIPVSIFYSLFLPAQQNFHDVFFLKIKNSALGFAPVSATPAAPGPLPPRRALSKPPSQEAPQLLQANFNLFLQFNRLNEGAQPESVKEIYVPCHHPGAGRRFRPENRGPLQRRLSDARRTLSPGDRRNLARPQDGRHRLP